MFWMSNKSVRLALVVSVMCTPPVSFQTSHESMVPNAKCSSPSTALGEQPLELRAREVGIENETGGAAHQIEMAIGLELLTARSSSAVLPDDRLVARHAGSLVPQHDGLVDR